MLRVRAQLSFHTFKYGDVFTIDETHPDWAEPLAEGWVAPVAHEVTAPATGWRPGHPVPAVPPAPGSLIDTSPFWVYTTGPFVPDQPETL